MCTWHLTLLLQRPTTVGTMCCCCADFKWCRNWNKVVLTDLSLKARLDVVLLPGQWITWSDTGTITCPGAGLERFSTGQRSKHNIDFSLQKTNKNTLVISHFHSVRCIQEPRSPLRRIRRRKGRRKRSCLEGKTNIHLLLFLNVFLQTASLSFYVFFSFGLQKLPKWMKSSQTIILVWLSL